jgi:hypothetical protein
MLAAVTALMLIAPQTGAEPTSDTPITVTGTRYSPAEAQARATAFVKAVLPLPAYGQYGRWTVPVCLKLTGITEPAASVVAARVRAVAVAAGIALARPGCRANLNIIFSEDGARTASVILRRRPGLVARLPQAEKTRLISDPLPVRWWYGIEVGDGSRVGAGAGAAGSAALNSAAGAAALATALPVGPDAISTSGYSASLIDTNLSLAVTSATAIVDVTQATGKSLDAVADHVAMIALAPTRLPPQAPGVPSILGLFTSGDDRLSVWDSAYLTALYRMTLNRSGQRQRGQLIATISAALAGNAPD